MPKISKASKPAAATPAAATATSTSAATAAAPAGGFRLASNNPEDFQSVGLASNFWGTIVDKFYGVFKHEKGKKAGQYGLAVYVVIAPDTDAEVSTNDEMNMKLGVEKGLVIERLGCGDLTHWIPLDEGMRPAAGYSVEDFKAMGAGKDSEGRSVNVPDSDLPALRGVYAGSVGSQQSLPKGTKYDQWLATQVQANFPRELTSSADVRYDVGLRAYWVRLPFEFKSRDGKGAPTLEEGQRAPDLLSITEIDSATVPGGEGKANGKGGATARKATAAAAKPAPSASKPTASAKPAPAPPAQAALSADLDSRVEALIVKHAAAGGGNVSRTSIMKAVLDELDQADKLSAFTLLEDAEWLESDDRTGFGYDPDEERIVIAD